MARLVAFVSDASGWVFDSPEERDRTIAAAKAHPREPGEGTLAYIARLAGLARLEKPEQLPLREPGEDG